MLMEHFLNDDVGGKFNVCGMSNNANYIIYINTHIILCFR